MVVVIIWMVIIVRESKLSASVMWLTDVPHIWVVHDIVVSVSITVVIAIPVVIIVTGVGVTVKVVLLEFMRPCVEIKFKTINKLLFLQNSLWTASFRLHFKH